MRRVNAAHRKHCNPIGIPTIVMHQMQPMASHKSLIKMPPNNNHKIFPNFFNSFEKISVSSVSSYEMIHSPDSFPMRVPFFVVLISYYFL